MIQSYFCLKIICNIQETIQYLWAWLKMFFEYTPSPSALAIFLVNSNQDYYEFIWNKEFRWKLS